jgi:hypothetical protein
MQSPPRLEDVIPVQTMVVGLCGAVAVLCGLVVKIAVSTALEIKATNTRQWEALQEHGDRLTAVETRCRELHRRKYDPPGLDPRGLRCNDGAREGES